MKYWIYQENKVQGPFDRAQIGEIKGFDEDTLVCPEGRKGTETGDWQRASMLPELSALLRRGGVATAPVKEDSELHNSVNDLKKRISNLENALDRIERRAEAQSHAESSRPVSSEDKEARLRIDALEAKLSSINQIEREINSLRAKLEAAGQAQNAAVPLEMPEPASKPAVSEPPAFHAQPAEPSMPAPVEFKMEEQVALPQDDPFSLAPSASDPGKSEVLPRLESLASSGVPTGVVPAKRAAWSKKQKLSIFLLVVLFSIGMVFVIYFSGKPEKSPDSEGQQEQKTPAVPTQIAPAAAPVQKPTGQESAAIQADLSQEAVSLVKNYKIPGHQEPLNEILAAGYPEAYPKSGELSPWMVEKLGEDKYQVTFYLGTRALFVFSVQPKAQSLQGVNSAAVSLLSGNLSEQQPPKKAVSKRRHRRRPSAGKAAAGSDSVVAPKAEGASKKQGKKNLTLDQLLGEPAPGAVSNGQ